MRAGRRPVPSRPLDEAVACRARSRAQLASRYFIQPAARIPLGCTFHNSYPRERFLIKMKTAGWTVEMSQIVFAPKEAHQGLRPSDCRQFHLFWRTCSSRLFLNSIINSCRLMHPQIGRNTESNRFPSSYGLSSVPFLYYILICCWPRAFTVLDFFITHLWARAKE